MKRILFLSLTFLLIITMFAAPQKTVFASDVISWGVVPNANEQKPPAPQGSQQMLDTGNGIYIADTNEKEVYFTFDLGYEAGYTEQVLDILKENNIKAIFFLCSNYLAQTELINRMIEEGHQIGNHTNKHKDLPTLSEESAKEDIVLFTQKFNESYNAPLKYFRPPQGRFNQQTLNLAKEEGLKTVMWSIAIVDWGKAPIASQANADKITNRLHPGAIALFHITNSGTPQMLNILIPQIKAKGYTIGDASKL